MCRRMRALSCWDALRSGRIVYNVFAQANTRHPMRFDDGKTEALNLRVSPSFKTALKTLAENENRSMVNMLEVLVMGRLAQSKLPPPAKPAKTGSRDSRRQA